jgi:two-component system, NtrC family, sensor kinase
VSEERAPLAEEGTMLHSLLARQLKRCQLSLESSSCEAPLWREFLERVNKAYSQADDERALQEHMMATLSEEMRYLNDSLRASEAHLIRERDKLQAIVTSVGDGMCVADAQGICRYLNPEGARLLGCDAQAFLGRPMHELCSGLSEDAICSARLRDDEGRFRRIDGTTFPAAYVLNPIVRDRDVQGGVLVFRDITEKRRLESERRQAQKLESVGRLAAGVAHEINTPVQFVSDSVSFVRSGFGDLKALLGEYDALRSAVLTGRADARMAEAVARAEEAADLTYLLENVPKALERALEGLTRVATIVRSMKEFAHPDQKEMAPVDLNQAIRSTLTIARNEYKYVAELETDLAEIPHVTCLGGEVNQVVLNIVVNAAHAIGDAIEGTEAKGLITVRTRLDGENVLVSISDTGGGIPEHVREHVFDPFFTTKEVGKGTGQGLAIARSVVVEKHGGELWFETELGKGTTFFIRLPIRGKAQRGAGACP